MQGFIGKRKLQRSHKYYIALKFTYWVRTNFQHPKKPYILDFDPVGCGPFACTLKNLPSNGF